MSDSWKVQWIETGGDRLLEAFVEQTGQEDEFFVQIISHRGSLVDSTDKPLMAAEVFPWILRRRDY